MFFVCENVAEEQLTFRVHQRPWTPRPNLPRPSWADFPAAHWCLQAAELYEPVTAPRSVPRQHHNTKQTMWRHSHENQTDGPVTVIDTGNTTGPLDTSTLPLKRLPQMVMW